MLYDDVSWHLGQGFPSDLPQQAAGTHAGMFLAWALSAQLANEQTLADAWGSLKRRDVTPGAFFVAVCAGRLSDEQLSATGNDFARSYFDLEEGDYLVDYEGTLGLGLPSHYHVPDSWQSFDALKPVLDARLADFRATTQRRAP